MALHSDLNQHNGFKLPKVVGTDSVLQSMENLLSTNRGERLFEPEVGSDLEQALFEPVDEVTENLIFDLCIRPLLKWDDRISIDFSKSSITAFPDSAKYEVLLAGVDKSTNEPIHFEGELSNDK